MKRFAQLAALALVLAVPMLAEAWPRRVLVVPVAPAPVVTTYSVAPVVTTPAPVVPSYSYSPGVVVPATTYVPTTTVVPATTTVVTPGVQTVVPAYYYGPARVYRIR